MMDEKLPFQKASPNRVMLVVLAAIATQMMINGPAWSPDGDFELNGDVWKAYASPSSEQSMTVWIR
jgi:hypothetical protein